MSSESDVMMLSSDRRKSDIIDSPGSETNQEQDENREERSGETVL